MNAPFPLNPQVGEWSGEWAWNGARWVHASTSGLRVLKRMFPASGPYMPTPGLVMCIVECIGGGGGGGPVSMADANHAAAGGGGGSGGYSIIALPAALVRGGVLVTVGQGGAGTLATTQPAQGWSLAESGTPTSFGALCVANGGWGGQLHNGSSVIGQSGDGASDLGAAGDLSVGGNCGTPGWLQAIDTFIWAIGGQGGAIMGGSGRGLLAGPGTILAGPDYENRYGPGAGGGGAMGSGLAGSANGGPGQNGLVIVTEYVVGDRDQPLTEWRPPLDVNVTLKPPGPHPWPHPPWPGGGPWPPGAWWPPGWGPGQPWPPGWGPRPPGIQPFEGQTIEGQEFEAGVEPFSQDPDPEDR